MDSSPQLPNDFVQLCRLVTAKRPKAVIDHILQYGFVTTEDLKQIYGYNHPPRAARDVMDGIYLTTLKVRVSKKKGTRRYKRFMEDVYTTWILSDTATETA